MEIRYEDPSLGDVDELTKPDEFRAIDEALCAEIGRWLVKWYPKHYAIFSARVDHRPNVGIVEIKIPRLMGASNVYAIPTAAMQAGPNAFHNLMKEATGQLLERFRLSRGRGFDDAAFIEAASKVPWVGIEDREVPV